MLRYLLRLSAIKCVSRSGQLKNELTINHYLHAICTIRSLFGILCTGRSYLSATKLLNEGFFPFHDKKNQFPVSDNRCIDMNNTIITWVMGECLSECGMMTHQYGVPMKESLLCKVLVFLADTPKSAERRCPSQKISSLHQTR